MGKSKKKKYSNSSSSSSSDSESSSNSSSSSTSSSDEKSKRKKHKMKKKHRKFQRSNSSKQSLAKSIGPVISNLLKKSDTYGPDLPQTSSKASNIIGPSLPAHLLKPIDEKTTSDSFGPSLPAHLTSSETLSSSDTFGPCLPPHLRQSSSSNAPPPNDDSFGPSLPPHFRKTDLNAEEDDDEVVGPLPEGYAESSATQKALELRAMLLKRDMLNKKLATDEDDGVVKRETWMLELPPEKSAHLGLGPRQFRAREAPDMSNRSEWTDTPDDKLRKQHQLSVEGELAKDPEVERKRYLIHERDKAMQSMIDKCKKSKKHKRDKSLLEMHQKKLKKNKKKSNKEHGDKPVERRPFDRNIDLQANRFDDAQKKALINKAQLLNTRFSTGESKFL